MRAPWLPPGLLLIAACAAGPAPTWTPLFDGISLAGWKVTEFGGEGAVTIDGGRLLLEAGSPLTGVTWEGFELPKLDYEIRLEAMRVDGSDFFCGMTFPVAESHCSLIVGGWGGALIGLSSLDGFDASQNETGRTMALADNHPYAIRVRVTADRIQAWIGTDQVIDAPIRGRKISIRPEVAPSRPLGIASFATTAALRGIELRRL